MSSADDVSNPAAIIGAVGSPVALRSSVSTVISGILVVAAVAVVRAAVLGPDADRSARLFLIVGGIGVWLALIAVVCAAGIGRQRPLATPVAGALVGFGGIATAVGLLGLNLRLGEAAGGAYQVPLWQLETEPIVAVMLGIAAVVIAIASRSEASSKPASVGSRRLTAIIGACVAAPIVRRLFGRAGDGAASPGWTVLLLLFDVVGLVVVAAVAYRGFGFGGEFLAQRRSAKPAASLREPIGEGLE